MILWRSFFLTIQKHNSNETQINSGYHVDNIKKESEEFKMAKSKLVAANQKIADGVVGGYKKLRKELSEAIKKSREQLSEVIIKLKMPLLTGI